MNNKFVITVENSAPFQKKTAKSVTWAAEILRDLGVTRVVDIGCGRLRNLKVFQTFFSHITLVDTELQCKRTKDLVPKLEQVRLIDTERFMQYKNKFHAAFLISVLHIIPDKKSRERILSMAIEKVRGPGYIVIDVPYGENYYRQKCTIENKYRDGWIMGDGQNRTFYKNYNARELDELLINRMSLELFKKVWFDKHIVRIMKRAS